MISPLFSIYHNIENLVTNKANKPVGKVLLTTENDVFGGHLTLPQHEIVAYTAS